MEHRDLYHQFNDCLDVIHTPENLPCTNAAATDADEGNKTPRKAPTYQNYVRQFREGAIKTAGVRILKIFVRILQTKLTPLDTFFHSGMLELDESKHDTNRLIGNKG
jgi:hypothetical protein